MHTVILDGVNITARCLDSISTDVAESGAATATFTYSPTTTPLLPTELIRKAVTIDWNGERIFTGQVAEATWDLYERVYEVTCSDLLQETFETMTDAQILAALPGSVYSIALFGEREDGWRFALDALSTITSEVHLTRGGILEVSSWAAKSTPDRTYTAGQILNGGAYDLELAKARDIVTQRKVKFGFRVNRWKVRDHGFGWYGIASPNAWCDWVQNAGWDVPDAATIRAAAQGTGWPVKGTIRFQGHPATGVQCGGTVNWINDIETDQAVAANWTGQRHWAQTVNETYDIEMNCTAAQVTFGLVSQEDEYASEILSDDTGFESGLPNVGDGWPTDSLGDRFEDQTDETQRQNDLLAGMGVSITYIWHALRQNFVTVEIPIEPTLSLDDTVRITTPDIDAQGKVFRFGHEVGTEVATTRMTLAISRGGGGSSDPVVVPGRPDSSPVHAAPPSSTTLDTYVGGCSDSPPYDDTWEGWSTIVPQEVTTLREDPDRPGEWIEIVETRPACSVPAENPSASQLYPLRFQVKGPDIEDEARNDVDALSNTTLEVAVPEDLLVLY